MTLWQTIGTAAGVVTTIGALVGTFFLIDDRYAHYDDLQNAKNQIITELRVEVVKNRAAMIENMIMEADDLGFEIDRIRATGKEAPRFMVEKHKTILRQIKALEDEN